MGAKPSMADYERMPILFAPDETGTLRHVDEVPNGLACGCRCPDPNCGQELVAKNAGTKRVHHFAHIRGACEWSVEHILMNLAFEAVSSTGRIAFPKLLYRDVMKGCDVELSPARTLRVSAPPSLEYISGRGAPELVVTCVGGATKKRFAVLISLIHPLKDDELEKLASTGIDVVLVDLCESYRDQKKQEGKHYDRMAIVASYQRRQFVERLMLDETSSIKTWAVNMKRALEEEESEARKRAYDAEQTRRKASREQERKARTRADADCRAIAKTERAYKNVIPGEKEVEGGSAERLVCEEDAHRENEQEFPAESNENDRCQSSVAASEVAKCERNGNAARSLIKRGAVDFALDCPLHGEAHIVMQCGAYSYSSSRCPHFVRMRNYVIECSFAV